MKFGNISLAVLFAEMAGNSRIQGVLGSIPPPPPPSMNSGYPRSSEWDQHKESVSSQQSQTHNPLPPPPPPHPAQKRYGEDTSRSNAEKYTSSSAHHEAPLVDERSGQKLIDPYEGLDRGFENNDEVDDYSEEITTREQAEQMFKGFGRSDSSAGVQIPQPPSFENNDAAKENANVINFENEDRRNEEVADHESMEENKNNDGISIPGPRTPPGSSEHDRDHQYMPKPPPSPYDDKNQLNHARNLEDEKRNDPYDYNQRRQESQSPQGWQNYGEENQEWIVPKENQFQAEEQPEKLHRPPPGPPPQGPGPNSGRESYGYEQSHSGHPQHLQEGQHVSNRAYPQRPHPNQRPPQQLAPRNYNYSRGPPHHQQPPYQRSQQLRQQYGPGSGPRPGPGPGALVPRRPQPSSVGSSLFQRFGKSLEALADVDTIISQKAQEVMKTVTHGSETVAGSMSGAMRKTVFQGIDGVTGIKEGIKDTVKGGMSNIFGGAPTSATETRDEWEDDRRKTVTENRRKAILGTTGIDRGGPGETYTGAGESPLQQHLLGLAQDLDEGQDSTVEDQHGTQDQASPLAAEARDRVGYVDQHEHDVDRMDHDQPLQEEKVQEFGTNPYAMLAYPASKDLEEDDSSDIEDYEDVVDPSTFFGTSPSSPSTPTSSPRSFEIETFDLEQNESLFRKVGGLFKVKVPSFVSRRKGLGSAASSGWSDDDEWDTIAASNPKHSPRSTSKRPVVAKIMKSNDQGSVEDLLMRHAASSPVARRSTANLLSVNDIRKLGKVGRSKASMDFLALGFTFFFIIECLNSLRIPFEMQSWSMPTNIDEGMMLLQQVASTVSISEINFFDTWAPFALVAAILSTLTKDVLFEPKSKKLISGLSKTIKSSVLQSQLFMRLESGMVPRKELMQIFSMASEGQGIAAIEIARLRAFVAATLVTILATTVAVVRPICMNIYVALVEFASYEGLRDWPIDWNALGEIVKDLAIALSQNLKVVLDNEVDKIISNPLAIVSTIAVAVALSAFSQLSVLERARSTSAAVEGIKNAKANNIQKQEEEIPESISNLGGSTASRLALQMQEGAVDKILHQYQMREQNAKNSGTVRAESSPNKLILRKFVYVTICGLLTTAPIIVHILNSFVNDSAIDWGQFSGIILVLLFTNNIARTALFASIDSTRDLSKVAPFLQVLSNTAKEIESTNGANSASTRTSASITKGLVVSDLWGAHVGKRAWACRGVNISCKAGEVVAILGEESSGKTRLLTAVGESLASPPRRSRSINIARGKISVGGLDVTEWNKSELKHKAAIFFNDMKTVSDMARFYSGTKLDDIIGLPCQPGAHEGSIRSAIGVAAQITGLSNGLLSKLPGKFDTVVTASEDDLKSPRGQDFTLLSSAEWSKVLLTKAIAQVVIANDNPMSNPNLVSKSLVGSILLLDELTNQLDEGEEIKLIKLLKSSGAASLITSKRWSIGMFADRIVVLKDGAVVESGTHHELMAKGSDNSIYASRWAQMLSS